MSTISARAFAAMQNLNTDVLANCSKSEIRPLLPSLVRMTLLSPFDNTKLNSDSRKKILSILVGIEVVNNIVSLLQVNYHELETDVKKEQQLRQKNGYTQQDSAQYHNLQNGIVLGFERADVTSKVRIVLSELFYIQSKIMEQNLLNVPKTSTDIIVRQSDLFDNDIYLSEITDIICIALAELPSLFNILEVVEILLYVNNGTNIICCIVANMPDCFKEVVTNLITNGDEETADGRLKIQALYALCEMNPSHSLSTRTLCMELNKMPSLMLKLSLNDPKDLVAFVTGLLLGNDQNIRSWFSAFIRAKQKRKGDSLQLVRDELLKQLQNLIAHAINGQMSDEYIVQGCALLRLYCALRGIAGIKFNDEEIQYLMQLITCKLPPTPTGIRFVTIGLCLMIACPSLIAQPSLEAKGIEWVQWLIREEAYFESITEVSASFGEMLLLMAIHFHSSQIPHITELVCSALGMRIAVRPGNSNRMKQIFTQEIFTEQVVTAHAVKVPVTINLNANIPGYLPVHCIYQLLKSRAFSKHKVPIKSWIYKQICNSTAPLHPVLPALIEVYVNSIIIPNVPNSKGPIEHTHKPLSELEILKVFQNSVCNINFDTKKIINTYNSYEYELESAEKFDNTEQIVVSPNLSSQLLLLYYLLLYEDVRLNNMTSILANDRKVKSYSTEFLAELPIKYLLQQAQRDQQNYSCLFSPLLRLLIIHFPHISLVDDWIEIDTILIKSSNSSSIQVHHVVEAFEEINMCPSKLINLLRKMLKKAPTELWPLASVIIHYFKKILDESIPRVIQELYKQVWIRLNTVLPRRLWVMSINALMPEDNITKKFLITHENILIDPLQILRCDDRVFRSANVLVVVLRILQASLAASKSQLTRHILDKPLLDKSGPIQSETEREELKLALVASQESVAVQILLEACLETEEDKTKEGRQWALREIRGIVCSYIHQAFIYEPSLAKLVHFQGYPRELLPMTVTGIPSMHICLDFLPELLSMPEMEKQIFAIDLTSHLALQYSLPKSLSVAKLSINTLTTLLGVSSCDIRLKMFRAVLPCIVRFGEAQPPLLDDCVVFLMQLGKIADSQTALGRSASLPTLFLNPGSKLKTQSQKAQYAEKLLAEVEDIFAKLLDEAVLKPKVY